MRSVALMVAMACPRAHADTPQAEPPDPPVVASYRSATLAADGAALGLILAGDAGDFGLLTMVGVSTYVVGAPVVHMTKGRYGHAAASLGLRVSLPLLGLAVGSTLPRDCGPTGDCMGPPIALYVGFAAGVVTAAALDTIVLASGDTEPSRPQSGWAPVARPTRDGVTFGVAGQF